MLCTIIKGGQVACLLLSIYCNEWFGNILTPEFKPLQEKNHYDKRQTQIHERGLFIHQIEK